MFQIRAYELSISEHNVTFDKIFKGNLAVLVWFQTLRGKKVIPKGLFLEIVPLFPSGSKGEVPWSVTVSEYSLEIQKLCSSKYPNVEKLRGWGYSD